MEWVNPLWWGDPGENVVGLVCVDFRADQPQPFTDAVDMGILPAPLVVELASERIRRLEMLARLLFEYREEKQA